MKKTIRSLAALLCGVILLLACCTTLASCDLKQMQGMVQDLSDALSDINVLGDSSSDKEQQSSDQQQSSEQAPVQTPVQTPEQSVQPPLTTQPGFNEQGELIEPDEALEALLYEAATQLREEVDISALGYTQDTLQPEIEYFFFTHPELFYVSNGYSILANKQDEVQKIKLKYLYSAYSIPAMLLEYRQMIAKIVSDAPKDGTDFDKLLYLHDYLVRNYAYDYDGLRAEAATNQSVAVRDAYNFFKSGEGVCQAYMLALIALCNELGIPCLPVTSEQLAHAWNLVQLDGKWYHVDVTWDDAGGEQSAVYPSYISYKYFLLSEQALKAGGRDVTWVAGEEAKDTKYDNVLWRDATTAMLKQDGEYFCTVYNDAIGKAQLYRGTPTQMAVALTLEDARWNYKEAWVSLAVWENVIVLNTATGLRYYDALTNTLTTVAEFNLVGRKQIFGIYDVSDEGLIIFVVARECQGSYDLQSWQLPAH